MMLMTSSGFHQAVESRSHLEELASNADRDSYFEAASEHPITTRRLLDPQPASLNSATRCLYAIGEVLASDVNIVPQTTCELMILTFCALFDVATAPFGWIGNSSVIS
jgi:hypothetical protein